MAYFDCCDHHIGQIKTVCLESKRQILVVKTSPYPRIYPTFSFDVAQTVRTGPSWKPYGII